MSLKAQVDQPFEAIATGAAPGLVGSITVEVYDPTTGVTVVPPTTAGITEPRGGTYVTALTVPTPGSFSVRWTTIDGAAEEELVVGAFPELDAPDGIRPSSDQIAAILRARTQDDEMNELGVFNDKTRPTGEQVDGLIDLAVGAFIAETGVAPCMESSYAGIQHHIAISTAMMIELSYFPEQIAADRSPFEQLRALWESTHAAIVENVKVACNPDYVGGEEGGAAIAMPAWSYEDPVEPRAPGANYLTWYEVWVGYAPWVG